MNEHPTASRILQSHSEAETVRIGRRLAECLPSGGIVQLYGDLGAGKTAFVRGLVEGSGGLAEDVSSPTFTLVQDYEGRVPFYHVDLYRITADEVDDLGLEDLSAGSLMAIEWAERLPRDMLGAILVYIEERGGNRREIRIDGVTRSGSLVLPS